MPTQQVTHNQVDYLVATNGANIPHGQNWEQKVVCDNQQLCDLSFAVAIDIVNAAHELNNDIPAIVIVGSPDSAEENSYLAANVTIYAQSAGEEDSSDEED